MTERMEVIDRLVDGDMVVINLTEPEKDVYCGSGWKLAHFIGGTLIGFFDPMDCLVDKTAINAIVDAMKWIENAKGEVWLVMCSGYQLCDPVRVSLDDTAGIAKMTRIFGEVFSEFGER